MGAGNGTGMARGTVFAAAAGNAADRAENFVGMNAVIRVWPERPTR